MSYHGDIALGNTIDIKFATRQSSGVLTTLAGTPSVAAYVGNSTVEITAGITLTVDFDARTGLNHVRVVASSGNGFATASDIDLVVTAGTVNSVSVVGEVVGSFSIENRSAIRPATAGRTLVVDASGLADANMVKAGPSGSGTTQTARDLGLSVLVSSGTGTGQISLAAGLVTLAAVTHTGAVIPTVTTTTTATNLTNAPTAGDFTAAMKTSLNAATPVLASGGLDSVVVEVGLNARQALAIAAAGIGGTIAGATSIGGTVTISGATSGAPTRVVMTGSANGNRTGITLTPPA